jgi:hypothetical protein
MQNIVGLIGVCSRGRLGLITGRKVLPWGESWVGMGLDDGSDWASREPAILPEDQARVALKAYADLNNWPTNDLTWDDYLDYDMPEREWKTGTAKI